MIVSMPQSSQNSSFIPKHSPTAKPRSSKKRSPALFTIMSGTLFGAVFIASMALLAYEWYLGGQFDDAVLELNQASESFNQGELVRVVEFDARLTAANNLFAEHVSINRALEELARLTVNSVQFTRVSLERTDRSTLSLEADVAADELGSVLVQKNTYANDELLNTVSFKDLTLNFGELDELGTVAQTSDLSGNFVGVTLELEFAANSVAYEGVRNVSRLNTGTVNSDNPPLSIPEDEATSADETVSEAETALDNSNL